MRKSVGIIGAGPAGLVAAKTFLQTGEFDVTIYEKKSRVGGIWAIDETTKDGFLDPQTPTNLSRYTVAFSDLDWNTVDLRSELDRSDAAKPSTPMFPKAWHVGRYLEEYQCKFIPGNLIFCGTEVVSVSSRDDGAWTVVARSSNGEEHGRVFDYLVVASGFFSYPRPLKDELSKGRETARQQTIAEIHSSHFKTLIDLFPQGNQSARRKDILVMGGGNSGAETSAAIAKQISDARWSPATGRQNLYEGTKIINVMPRQMYSLPPFYEYAEGSKTYVPIDFKLYDYSKRTPWPPVSYGGYQKPEARKISHSVLQSLVGDQSDLGGEALTTKPEDQSLASGYAALSESYAEYVRSGMIEAIKGRVTGINHSSDGFATAHVANSDGTFSTLNNIGAIVHATGFTPSPALEFLDSNIKSKLQYSPTSTRLPIMLNQYQTANPAVPNLAFLGWYEGPYWPIMELQAHLTAHRWLNKVNIPLQPYEEPSELLRVRQKMQEHDLGVGQFWFQDYMGYFEDIAHFVQLKRNDGPFHEREGLPHPSRYLTPQSDVPLNTKVMHELHNTWSACIQDGKYVPRAVFRALQGHWNISRQITSADPNFSGSLTGTAAFHPRVPTNAEYDFEYLYTESGTFTASSSGVTMQASRRYVYRYRESRDEMSVWFVKPSNDLEVDYLFHKLAFVTPAEAREEGALVAKGDHLCVEDMYYTQYQMPMEKVSLKTFEVTHKVVGPTKDYVATTGYARPALEKNQA